MYIQTNFTFSAFFVGGLESLVVKKQVINFAFKKKFSANILVNFMERNCQLSSSPAKPSLRNSGDRMGNARFHTKTQMPYLFLAISHKKKPTSFLKNVFLVKLK